MLFYSCIVFVVGIIVGSISLSSYWFWLLQGMALLFIRRFLYIAILLILGMQYYAWRYHQLFLWHLPPTQIKKTLTLQGSIVSLPKITPQVEQFEFETAQHQLIRLSWYHPYQRVQYGDQWRLSVSLKPPVGLYNPGGFNYRQWLIMHNIKAIGYVKSRYPQQLLQHIHGRSLTKWRETLADLIKKSISQSQIAALIMALTIGSHNLVQTKQWHVLQRTGTNHLIAIAGLHIGFVVMFAYFLIGWLWSRSQQLMLWWPRQYAQASAAVIVALCYGLLAGFSLPTQRAVIMVAVMMIGILLRQPVPLWQRFVFAFCVIVMSNPFDLMGASLWMSFGSVFFIIYVCQHENERYKKWKQWWRLQVALLIGLAPLTIYFYHQLSLIGFFANALAVPWVGFLIVPLCLLAALLSIINSTWAMILFKMAGSCITPLWYYLVWLSRQSWGVWQYDVSQIWVLIITLIAVIILLMPRGFWLRWLGLLWLLPLCLYTPPGPRKHQLWITVLDVGQGLSVLLRTQHHTLLYDAGPKSYSGFDAGAEVVVPYLHYVGVKQLSMLMISHGDNDHIGGAAAVLQAMTVNKLVTSVPSQFKLPAIHCYRGQHWRWDGIQFQVLWPRQGQPYADNNSSCVLLVTNNQERVLLTGDIEASTEQALLRLGTKELATTLLVAPHHGSGTSSTLDFVRATQPKLVIFPTGAYNRYHFPSPAVVQRYSNLHAKLYNTAFDGAVSVHFSSEKVLSIKTAGPSQ